MAEQRRQFLYYIHEFRGIAIVLIVASHVFYGLTDDNAVIGFVNATVRNSTVLFLFISGYLFQYLSANFKLLPYWEKKIMYVLLPYVIVSLPIIAARLMAMSHMGAAAMAEQGVMFLLTGSHLLPFWYIPVIVLFFAIAPLMIYIDRHPRLYYILPLLLVISFTVPRDELNNIPKMAIHFFSVYVAGMFMSHFRERIYVLSNGYKWWFTGITIFIFILAYLPQHESFLYFGLQYVKNLLLCWLLIFWLQKKGSVPSGWMTTLAEYSFGIYFLHFPFLIAYQFALKKLVPISFNEPSVWWIPLFFAGLAAGVLGSIVIIKIVRALSKSNSRLLVGS
jgi:peptidoglycan/LPS O-acetylase OafA/YrhL